MFEDVNVDDIINDRAAFDNLIYTPLKQALQELSERQFDESISLFLKKEAIVIPQQLEGYKNAVLFRNIITPNFELRRFISLVEPIPELRPVVMEYHHDRFLNRNDCKFALGKICFNRGKNQHGEMMFESKVIIDINDSNTKKIADIKTYWSENLVDFHHNFLKEEFLIKINTPVTSFDASDWISNAGKDPQKYYKSFLSLFLNNSILFENFLLDQKEIKFTREVILPAFLEIYKQTGKKPLIVALSPTEIEGDSFWLSYPSSSKQFLDRKMNPDKNGAIS